MKTDSQIKRDVLAELDWEPKVDHADIGVAVTDGVVTLSGFVGNYASKLAAEKASRRVMGVRGLAEEIEVRYASEPKMADADVAKRIADMFDWTVSIPSGDIDVKVEDGWVTLTGNVGWQYQRVAAKDSTSRIEGVKGISNLINVEARVSASDVKDKIVSAIRRAANVDANAIIVESKGDTVKLSGKVHGLYERQVAENAAWAAPGVNRVVDNIAII